MNIYFFGADYPPTGGGIATFAYEWMQAVRGDTRHIGSGRGNGREHRVSHRSLIFGNKNPRIESFDGLKVKTVRSVNPIYVGVRVLWSMLTSRKVAVYHSFNLFPVGYWVVLWAKLLGKKSAVTFYGTDACSTRGSALTARTKGWTIRNATYALTISEYTKHAVCTKYNIPQERIHVVYPPVPTALLARHVDERSTTHVATSNQSSPLAGISDETFLIISVARLVERKAIDDAIRAVVNMPKEYEVLFLIIGDGPERARLEQLIEELDAGNRVRILGRVPDVTPIYRRADVALLVSYNIEGDGDFEGLGLALTEAQSYGVPVIGSRSGGIPETFSENVTGLMVPPRDTTALTRALNTLYVDDDMRERFSRNTHTFLEQRFGTDTMLDAYFKILNI